MIHGHGVDFVSVAVSDCDGVAGTGDCGFSVGTGVLCVVAIGAGFGVKADSFTTLGNRSIMGAGVGTDSPSMSRTDFD